MTLNLLIVVGLVAVLFIFASVRELRRHRRLRGFFNGLIALLLCAFLAAAFLVSVGLKAYRQMNGEQTAGELQFTQTGYHQFNGVFTFPSGERADFALRGDEWQLDARLLKWKAIASLIGIDAGYRLDRISGRYSSIEDERQLPRTVYEMHAPDHIDLWALAHRYQAWLPGVDALYGSAAFLPMADGAAYAINVSESGLIARPLNQSARSAVGSWR